MMAKPQKTAAQVGELDAVALLTDRPADGRLRGQAGTVVDMPNESDVLVEFCDDDGRAYAVVACARADLLPLRYLPRAA